MADVASDTIPHGFAIGYERGKGTFRVYVSSTLAIVFAAVAYQTGNGVAMVLAAAFTVTSFYFYPLIEPDRARLGANEYGLFIEGFGLISWRGISGLRIATRAVRNIEINELEISLSQTLGSAILADWRDLPYHRLLMKLPWRMPNDRTILVDLEPFAGKPQRTLGEILRRWRYFG